MKSHSQENKGNKNKSPSAVPLSKVKSGWEQKRPVVFFIGGFAVLMILFYILWLSTWFNLHVQPHIESGYAWISSSILVILGQNTQASMQIISSPVFSLSINHGCDAVEAMALFAAALLAFPIAWKKKITGLLAGIFFLYLLNVLRIVSLFLTGVYAPKAFDMMHVEVWQVIFIIFALGLWLLMIRRAGIVKRNVQ